jgi:hypothetical protein
MKKAGLVFLVLIAVVVTFLVGAADEAYAATGSLLIPVSEFTTDGGTSTSPGDFSKIFPGGYLLGGGTGPCFVAPVSIPGNATKINKVIVYLIDDGLAAFNPYFELTAINMATAFFEDYVNAEVTDGTGTIQAIELPLIQKTLVKGRVYQLAACLMGGQLLYGVKVVYTVP